MIKEQLLEVIYQIIKDVEDAENTSDIGLLYERMLANTEDLKGAIT